MENTIARIIGMIRAWSAWALVLLSNAVASLPPTSASDTSPEVSA